MSRWNREFKSRAKGRESSARLRARLNAPRDRRGVLLLVVLSLLVLFMLIGTAFLMSSNQYKTAATASAKVDRVGNFPTRLLDRAMMQVLCDTGNPNSVIRHHSLLRDFYGTEGFEALVYSPVQSPNLTTTAGQVTRYAAATVGTLPAIEAVELGPTQGQLIDIYVRELAYKADDPLTPIPLNEATGAYALTSPDTRHILKLERSVIGLPEMYNMPLTKGYFNGCLLTVTSGPAAGQSTRIVDYEEIDLEPTSPAAPADGILPVAAAATTAPFPQKPFTRMFRLRVMAFPRADGSPLVVSQTRSPELSDLANATFIVNGRPFSGTGTGFNELAKAGDPRLNAREGIQLGTTTAPTRGTLAHEILNPEIALAPNAAFSFVADPTNSASDLWGARYATVDNTGTRVFMPLNPTNTDPSSGGVPIAPINLRPLLWKYPTFSGPGDADESYDAADSQNMALALLTVTPRARGRVVQGNDPRQPVTLEVDDPNVSSNIFLRLDLEDLPWPSYHRPDLSNFWFHRLAQYAADPIRAALPITDDAVRAVLAPYGADGIRDNADDPDGVDLEVRDQIVVTKRKISLRPIQEDHPGFDGSNPASRAPDLSSPSGPLVRNGNIAIPFWEAVGPWDVDNDNDGVADSVWVDLGEPVQQAEDGTLYKPLYAFLIVDLDSRLNVNAHGLVEHLRAPNFSTIPNPNFDPTTPPSATNPKRIPARNLANDLNLPGGLYTSNFLPAGSGYGPAEISLRPLFSPNLPGNAGVVPDGSARTYATLIGNPAYDDYARILVGRPDFDGLPFISKQNSVWGRHGSVNIRGIVATDWQDNAAASVETLKVRPGIPYNGTIAPGFVDPTFADRLALFKFFGYPVWPSDAHGDKMQVPLPTVRTAFSSPPDLQGRYSIGLDYTGQAVDEAASDAYLYANSQSLLVDTPYELDLSDSRRRDAPDASVASAISVAKTAAVNDDAPFATADLEHILRAHDADSGILPDRLWNVVDAFDPLKLRDNQPQLVNNAALATFGTAGSDERLAAAQQLAEVNRRLVTTDSYDVPVPTGNFLKRLIYGADGLPGVGAVDDDRINGIDDPGELGWYNSDDWYAVMYHQPKPLPSPPNFNTNDSPNPPVGVRLEPQNPTIVDLLRYRVQFERRKRGVPLYTEAELTAVTQQLLSPEILAGGKMDLNRPFGDGRDNGDGIDNDGLNGIDDPGEFTNYPVGGPNRDPYMDGVVDDPLEAGEPFVDSLTGPNHNGKRDPGEYFFNFYGGAGELTNNDANYNGPRDTLWQNLTGEPIRFSYNHGGVTTDGRLYDTSNPRDGDVNDATDGRLRYNGIIQRQTYARHLYCLMMLLVDENYIASQNVAANAEGNINLQFFYKELWSKIAYELAEERGRAPVAPDRVPTPIQQDYTDAAPIAERLALQKLTARKIAQWAINAVDFRDADSEMTSFEYDENPFDGWGLYVPDPANSTGAPLFAPIDGDLATNENWGGVKPFQIYPTKFNRTAAANATTNADDDANAVNSTRGVVWGTERPELLITETLAFHDRRTTDEEDTGAVPANLSILSTPGPGQEPDYDLDQRLKPRGSLYFELYNPNSEDGPRPADLYGKERTEANRAQGVMLNRLSTIAVPTTVGSKRSPVWRVAVVQDPVNGRLTNQIIDISTLSAPAGAEDRQALASQFLTTDASGFGFDSDRDAERLVYFTTGRDYETGLGSDVSRDNDIDLQAEYQGLLRDRVANPNNPNIAVWVPPLPFRELAQIPAGYNAFVASSPFVPSARRYFIARNQRRVIGDPTPAQDVAIAPILPGRYAVVGSSGIQFDTNNVAGPASLLTTRYVTPISRWLQIAAGTADPEQSDADHLNPAAVRETRRFEMWPSTNPDRNRPAQWLIGENAGPEIVSVGGNFLNVTDANLDGIPDSQIVDPAVTIPIEDVNISEPVEGYPSARYVLMHQDPLINTSASSGVPLTNQKADLNSDGELAYPTPYNRPLDMEDVLLRNATTQNYRSLHLQRLANPQFPWNPPAFDDRGVANAMHRTHLPINPYLTVDSQSADLTAFNGASHLERTQLPFTGTPQPRPNRTPTEDLLQLDYFAPLSAGEYLQAPDHVLAGLIAELAKEGLIDPWRSVESVRGTGSTADESTLRALLNSLEQKREGNTDGRGRLLDDVTEWGWHRLRRIMPDDSGVAPSGTYSELEYIQRLNFKSLERGAHHQSYYKFPQPGSIEGWWFDTNWTPRLLWKQERPNTMLFLRNAGSTTVRVTDMKNVPSRRMIMQRTADNPRTQDHFTQDDDRRNAYLAAGGHQLRQHVVDFVTEQTLGFVNESFAPDLDRTSGSDESAMLKIRGGTPDPMPGAPEIASNPASPASPAQPEVNELNRWNTVGAQEQKVLIQPAEELQRRQRLMRSTFPWLTWNNRPFTSADELTQVPASSPSLMLREYSVASRSTANPYDGNGIDDANPGQLETVVDRLARQNGPFGQLLNFFQAADKPAGTYKTAPGGPLEPLSGGPNYYRLLDFVEVPSRYVGTDTLLSPEIFNDNPLVANSVAAPSEDITALDDPRLLLQPPFNKVSRQRDPGRVNLNTVTGRRRFEASGFIRHWSEVYDGIMHRYGDGNLMDSTAANPSALQLSHFGPAWRDVALSRRGYAQFNAAPISPGDPLTPIEKLVDTQNEPETFASGLNRDFPSVFSNPFRSSDAGDLVPLPNMVRPGVDATILRGLHWQRAFEPAPNSDNVLITNPFSPRTVEYPQVAWGVAGFDDDRNGIVDDVREAGYGIIENPPTVDGDTLRVRPSLNNALESSGIPLFSEEVPEPAINGERNPGMMYQPMTRLGNLVTTRSNVYAIWVTVGYFEVERAPDWNETRDLNGNGSPDGPETRARFGGTTSDTDASTVRARALYDRVYPDGYMLGEELGTDTGDTNRERAFYIIDRTEPVGFKPGEELNVDKMIRVRRRIE